MTISNFAFTPGDGLRNHTSFQTTPNTEDDARNQFQTLLDQIKDEINNTIITEINNKLGLGGGNLTGALSSTGNITGLALIATGLTGATAASRYAGATTSGAPTTGTFQIRDWVIDGSGAIWVCTSAGTPGTWTKSGGNPTAANLITGTYTGDGTATAGAAGRLISVGVQPKLVWIVTDNSGTSTNPFGIGFPENTNGEASSLMGEVAGQGSATSTQAPQAGGDPNGAFSSYSNQSAGISIEAGQNGFLVWVTRFNISGRVYRYWALY